MPKKPNEEFHFDASVIHNLRDDDAMAKGMIGDLKILQLFELMLKKRASDLHLVVDAPPVLRIDGQMVRVSCRYCLQRILKNFSNKFYQMNKKRR